MRDDNFAIDKTSSSTSRNTAKSTVAARQNTTASGLKFEHGFCGDPSPDRSILERARAAPSHEQTFQPSAYLLITWFGKLHYVSPALYLRDADKYHELHWKEACLLLDNINSNLAIYDEWANPRGFWGGSTAKTVYAYEDLCSSVDSWVNSIEKTSKPDLDEFYKLTNQVMEIMDRLTKNDLDPCKVAQDGIDLEHIREDFKNLMKSVVDFRERAIKSAEHITAGLETVESTAFQILNVVPTLTFMDPFREAAYKIIVLLVRASTRGAGGYFAYDYSKEAALREAFSVIRKEAAGVIVDIVFLPVDRLFKAVAMKGFTKHFCTICVQQIIEYTCWYYKTMDENQGKPITDKQREDMLYERTASLIGSLVGLMFPTNLGTSARETLVKTVAENIVRNLSIDCVNAERAAREQNRDFLEVLIADLPGTLMRIIQGGFVGLIQRRAQQSGQFIEQQRATRGEGGTNRKEAIKILNESDHRVVNPELKELVSETEAFRPNKRTLREIRNNRVRNPVPAFTFREYNTIWKKTNLDYSTAQALRRFSDNNNLVMIAMNPARTRTMHTDTPEARGAKGPKSMGVKGKTSNHPQYGLNADGTENRLRKNWGLVLKPADMNHPDGTTHTDYSAAKVTWDKSVHKMFEGGFMVSPDRIVFHPEQLTRWAQLHPEDAADCQTAIETLNNLSAGGVHDLTQEVRTFSGPLAKERVEFTSKLLSRIKIGYYSDVDLVEVVDFTSGQRRFMGDLGEEKEIIQLARDNREHANKEINIHDYVDPKLPRDVHRLARPGDTLQHGGNNETVTLTASRKIDNILVYLDNINMVFPGGELVVINEETMTKEMKDKYKGLSPEDKMKKLDEDVRFLKEVEINIRLGNKYQEFANRAEQVRKSYDKSSPRFHVKGKKPPKVTPMQAQMVQKMFNGIEILDEKGLGVTVEDKDISTSLVRRGLDLGEWHITEACYDRGEPGYRVNRHSDLKTAKIRYNTFIGIENIGTYDDFKCGNNIVIAISHYKQTIAEAIVALLRTREALGNISSSIKIWYEIYTAYRPVSVDYIRDRIGGPDTGITPGKYETFKERVNCFAEREKKRLYAFSVTGFADTFTPTPGKNNKLKGDHPFQGLLLTNVWEEKISKEHWYQTTESSGGERFIVFPESLFTRDPSTVLE